MALLLPEDHERIASAVARAERESDGEIVTVITARSDKYHDVALHYAILFMLLVPLALAVVPQDWIDWAVGLLLGWNAEPSRAQVMLYLFAKMAAVFLIVRFGLAYLPLRMALTPGATRSRRVRRRAIELFRASCERKTRGRTGILIYLSLAERRAEIIADEAIARQVDASAWGEAMAALIDEVKAGRPGEGLLQAVERVGAVLARVLPPTRDNPDELPNRVVEL